MESQPQNPEFRNNPKNFHPCEYTKVKSRKHLYHFKRILTGQQIFILIIPHVTLFKPTSYSMTETPKSFDHTENTRLKYHSVFSCK